MLIPALNEEQEIEDTVEEALCAANELLEDYELFLVNDGSSDRTPQIMDSLAAKHEKVVVVHNPEPRGLGWSFRHALGNARFSKLTLIPGDHTYTLESLRRLFRVVDGADLVITYRTNQFGNRPAHRVILSLLYKRLMGQLLFHFELLDMHSLALFPVDALRNLQLKSGGYAYQLEVLIRLVSGGSSVIQVPVTLNPDEGRRQSLRPKTFVDVAETLWRLRRFSIDSWLGRR